jgi:hypothetical protein
VPTRAAPSRVRTVKRNGLPKPAYY